MTLDEWLRRTGTTADALASAMASPPGRSRMSLLRLHRTRPTEAEAREIARITRGEVTGADWDSPGPSGRIGRGRERVPTGIWMLYRDGVPLPGTAALHPEDAWARGGFSGNPYLTGEPLGGHAVRMVSGVSVSRQVVHNRRRKVPPR